MAPVQSIWWKVRVEKEHWQQLIRGASTAEHWPEEANSVALGIQTQRNTEYKQKIYLGVALSTLLKKKEKKKYFITFEPLWEIKHNHHTPTHIWNVSTEAKVQFIIKKKGIVQAKDKQLVVYMQSLRATLRQNLRHGRQRRASIEIYTARGIKNKLRLLQEFKQPAIENKCFLAHHICKHAESGNTKD